MKNIEKEFDDARSKFYESVVDLLEFTLSKEQEESVLSLKKTHEKLKKHWSGDFEKIKKTDLAEHCFNLFESVDSVKINLIKAKEVQKNMKDYLIKISEIEKLHISTESEVSEEKDNA